jgi:2-aminobenzoate-CoA ligase
MPALIWHTGGTTGVPKACYHTHYRYLLGGLAYGAAVGCSPGRRFAAAAPVGHALGFLCYTTFSLLHGASAVLIEPFSRADAVLDAIGRHRVDTFIAITATWAKMIDALEGDPRLDAIGCLRTGYAMWQSATSAAVSEKWRARGIELLNNFGSTAFATWVLVPPVGETVAPASLGRASPGYEVRAVDPESTSLEPVPTGTIGRMTVRGPTGLTYWNRPHEQQRDVVGGWTLVDDLIAFDDEGCATYFGRTDYVISSAGYKIAPLEVEGILARHPAVAEVGVVGAPDALRRELVCAFVVLAPGWTEEVTTELQEFVKAELAPYKYPRRVEYVSELPRDHVGKLQPRILQQWAKERSARGAPVD